jgi:hypothetical protein
MQYQSKLLRILFSSSLGQGLGCLVLLFLCMPSFSAQADFYSWVGPDGRRQVSNVPLSGFTKEGGIRQAYDPRSIVYQHAKMLESIAAQSQEISRQINATRGRSDAPGVSGQLTAPRRARPPRRRDESGRIN